MEKDERLLPLPTGTEIQTVKDEYPASYSPFYDDDSFENKRSIKEYFNIVYKRLPLIVALTVVTTAVVALYMFSQPSQYLATTEMLIEPKKSKLQSKDAININFGGDRNYYNTQLLLLKNSDLMRDVVIRLGLHRDPNGLNNQRRGFFDSLRSMFSGKEEAAQPKESSLPVLTDASTEETATEVAPLTPEEKTRAEMYAGMLLGGLDVDRVEDTSLVKLSIRNTDRALAARVANATAQVFIEQNIKRETAGAERDLEDLSKSIEELKGTIFSQEQEMINYMRNSNLPLAEKGQELSASRLQELSGQWMAATDERRKIEASYNAAVQANARGEGKNMPALGGSEIYRDTVRINTERGAKLQDRIRDLEKQIADAETVKSQLLVKYTPEYYKVKEKEAEIAKLQSVKTKMETEVAGTIERDQKKIEKDAISGALVGLRSQLEAAVKREGQARDTYNREISIANVQGVDLTRLTTLKREIDTKRTLLDTYIQRQKEQELIISSSRPDNIKIATEAQTPLAPVGPQRNRNILVAFLLSLGAGIGLAFLMDFLDDSIRTSDDIGRHLGLPTLALIPHQDSIERRTKQALVESAKNGGLPTTSLALIAIEDKRSAVAEAYRHLRTSLLFSSAGKPPQTMLVTSSQPSEGKTTTAINTAITLAQSGADVVIVDCDLRRPRLHTHFGLPNSTGLTNYLSGERNTENLVKPFPSLPNLKIITSGPIPPNPAELLSSNEMKNLLQFLRGKYKHVVVDSPPAISFTDAAILATLVDGVILVAMAGKSSIHLMRRFKQRLANIGARIYGVVLNGIRADSVEYGYYGYGYTYSYYEANDDDETPRMEEWEDILSIEEDQPADKNQPTR